MPTYKERKEIQMRNYISVHVRGEKRRSLIDERNRNSLTHLLKDPELTIEEKKALVAERNPFLYLLVGSDGKEFV